MDKSSTFTVRNPVALARGIGVGVRRHRLAKGWTQEELAQRAGVALSTLKLLEAEGKGSISRLIRVAIVLGIDGGLRELFPEPVAMESLAAVKGKDRKRAPRRKREGREGGGDGT